MSPKKKNILFMQEALKLAARAYEQDEVPVGAVIVYKDRIIGKGCNQVEMLHDASAHAEMIALTAACDYLRSKWLHKCTLYVTVEPCTMCAGALVLSRIERVVFGVADPKTGAFGSKLNINRYKLNHTIRVTKGVLQSECRAIVQQFFKEKRHQKKLAKP